MGGPSAQSFLVGVLGRCELLLVLVCAAKPAFSEADPSRPARGVWQGPGHIPALGGVSAKFLRGDHRPIRSSCNAHQEPTRRPAQESATSGTRDARSTPATRWLRYSNRWNPQWRWPKPISTWVSSRCRCERPRSVLVPTAMFFRRGDVIEYEGANAELTALGAAQ